MSFQNTDRFDEPDNEMLDEVRRQFAEMEKYGFTPGWAEEIINQYPVKLTKMAAVTEEFTPDHFIGGDMNEMDFDFDTENPEEVMNASLDAYKKYKWIAVLELADVSLELTTAMFEEFSSLTDEELRQMWDDRENIRDEYASFEEFRAEIRRSSQALGLVSALSGGMMSDMLGGLATYDNIPEVGDNRLIEYTEPEGEVLGAYDLTETEPGSYTSADVRVSEGEILGFVEPDDEIDKALMHPPARVAVDGQEYIVPPSNVRGPDGTASGPSMSGLDGLLGDMMGGGMGGMGDGMGGGDLGDLFGGGMGGGGADDFRFEGEAGGDDPFDIGGGADDPFDIDDDDAVFLGDPPEDDEDFEFGVDDVDDVDRGVGGTDDEQTGLDDDPEPPEWVDEEDLEGDGDDSDDDDDDDVSEFSTDGPGDYWR